MRLLADENIPGGAVDALRAAGHDVIWLRTAAPALPDHEAVAWAARDERVILTFDKDFGELAVRHRLPDKSGVVLFRLPMTAVRSIGHTIAQRLKERDDWAGHFSVVEAGRIRMRPLNFGS